MNARKRIDEAQMLSQVNAPAGLLFPLVVNVTLFVATATIIVGGVFYYQRASRMAVAFENRFITIEWRLLSQLKAETDRRLEAKDREIAFLRQQYQELVAGGGGDAERAEVNQAIEQAYAEREDLLVTRISAPMLLTNGSIQAERGVGAQGPTRDGGEIGAGDASAPTLPELFSTTDSQALVWYRRGIDDLLGIGEGGVLARVDAGQNPPRIADVSVGDHDRLRALAGLAARNELMRSELASLRSQEEDLTGTIRQLREEIVAKEDRIGELRAAQAVASRRIEEAAAVERGGMENELIRLEADNQRLDTELSRRESELARAETENRRLRNDLSRMEAAEATDRVVPDADVTEVRQEAYQSGYTKGLQEGRAEGFQDGTEEGRAVGRETALTWISTAMRYLSGGSVSNIEEVREALVTQWLEDGALREVLIQAQRLSTQGIPSNRNTLPQLSLLGVVAAVQDDRVRVEMITERSVAVGERVEVRSRGDAPPGDLKATATVVARVGTIVQIEIAGEPSRPLERDDLVYSIVLP